MEYGKLILFSIPEHCWKKSFASSTRSPTSKDEVAGFLTTFSKCNGLYEYTPGAIEAESRHSTDTELPVTPLTTPTRPCDGIPIHQTCLAV